MTVETCLVAHHMATIGLVIDARADQSLATQFKAADKIPAGDVRTQAEILLHEHDIGLEETDCLDDLLRIIGARHIGIGFAIVRYKDASDFIASVPRETEHGTEGNEIDLDDEYLFHLMVRGLRFERGNRYSQICLLR